MSGPRFQRGNFMVADLDRALAFYRDILGLTPHEVQPFSPVKFFRFRTADY